MCIVFIVRDQDSLVHVVILCMSSYVTFVNHSVAFTAYYQLICNSLSLILFSIHQTFIVLWLLPYVIIFPFHSFHHRQLFHQIILCPSPLLMSDRMQKGSMVGLKVFGYCGISTRMNCMHRVLVSSKQSIIPFLAVIYSAY